MPTKSYKKKGQEVEGSSRAISDGLSAILINALGVLEKGAETDAELQRTIEEIRRAVQALHGTGEVENSAIEKLTEIIKGLQPLFRDRVKIRERKGEIMIDIINLPESTQGQCGSFHYNQITITVDELVRTLMDQFSRLCTISRRRDRIIIATDDVDHAEMILRELGGFLDNVFYNVYAARLKMIEDTLINYLDNFPCKESTIGVYKEEGRVRVIGPPRTTRDMVLSRLRQYMNFRVVIIETHGVDFRIYPARDNDTLYVYDLSKK